MHPTLLPLLKYYYILHIASIHLLTTGTLFAQYDLWER